MRELIAIVIGITFGILVGIFYGYSMWFATGGPERDFQKLEKTYAQKIEFIQQANAKAIEPCVSAKDDTYI